VTNRFVHLLRAAMYALRGGFLVRPLLISIALGLLGAVLSWRLHDLRRSVATGMAEIGTQPHIIEAVLNHVSGHKAGVAGVYNRATYLPEKTAALTQWAEHLQAVVTGEPAKVVPMRSATA
jgi:hypothetical protein